MNQEAQRSAGRVDGGPGRAAIARALAAHSKAGQPLAESVFATLDEQLTAPSVILPIAEVPEVQTNEVSVEGTVQTLWESSTHWIQQVGLSDGTRQRTEDLAARAVDAGIGTGCDPGGLAAGCVYAASQSRLEGVTETELPECVDVTAVTIRSRWKELRPLIDG